MCWRSRSPWAARAAARLEHPNVVDVLDTGVDEDGSVYLVLELLRGESLGELLDRHVVLGPERTVQLMLPVMRALTRAHEAGIVHRDLKPDNIYLSHREGEVTPKLLDFGIAKVLDESGSFATRTGMVMGTPHYMAPEHLVGAAVVIMMRPDPSSIAPPSPLTNAERAELAPEPQANVVQPSEPEPVAIVATDPEPTTEPAEEVTETPQEPHEAPRRRRRGQASEEVSPPPRTPPTESEPDPMELRDQW